MTALPALRHSAAASAVTFGRLSKMTPMTPSGTRTRSNRRPLGRVHSAMTAPTGSGRSRTPSTPAAMASIRAGFSARRSTKAAVMPSRRASATSSALAARIAGAAARIAAAMAPSAAFFSCAVASMRRRAAARARRPRSAHRGLEALVFLDEGERGHGRTGRKRADRIARGRGPAKPRPYRRNDPTPALPPIAPVIVGRGARRALHRGRSSPTPSPAERGREARAERRAVGGGRRGSPRDAAARP